MAASVNDRLESEAIHHMVDLAHYSNGVVRRMVALLNKVDADLVVQLQAAIERMEGERFTVQRLDALLRSVRELNAQAYTALTEGLASEMSALVGEEVNYQEGLWRKVLPPQLNVASVTPAQVYSGAMARPFQGRLLKEWAQTNEAQRMMRVRDAVRMGFVEGKTSAEIVRQVRGTRARKYTDGLLETDRRHAQAIVQTAVQHFAASARNDFLGANADLIKAEKWNSTLDSHTSQVCIVRDGLLYAPVTHKPIGHKIPWLGGPGKAHWCCRSGCSPVLKGWEELGLSDGHTRASMDGQVPAGVKYDEWLAKQSPARQIQVLGPMRAELLQQGRLQVDKFWNDKGQWLTLAELKERNASAFERAGL